MSTNRFLKFFAILIVAFAIPSVVLFPAKAASTNYYVRAGATGTKNGSDWTNAYATLPSTLVRGATYYIADGIYGGYTFDDTVSGTQYITIKKAIASDHGTNTGWNAGYGDGQALFNGSTEDTLSFNTDYWIFDGQTGGGPNNWRSGFGFKITTSNCSASSKLVFVGNGADYITVKHAEMQHCGMNKNYNQDILYAVSSADGGSSNLMFSDSYLHDVNRVHLLANYVTNSVFENNFFEYRYTNTDIHGEGMSINYSGNDANNNYIKPANITIRNNIFKDIYGTGYIVIKDSVQSGFSIYGNVFYATDSKYYATNGIITNTTGDSITDIKVYNNTFFNVRGSSSGADSYPVSWDVSTKNEFFNNICFGCKAPVGVASKGYNVYTNSTLASRETGGQYWSGGNSLFVNSATGDFRLNKATQAGFTLPSSFSADVLNNTRGNDGVWDKGAYEYVSTTVNVDPPVVPDTTTPVVPDDPPVDTTTPVETTQPTTPVVPSCIFFTYSAWGTCQSNSTQIRTVSTQSPTGCTGGTPFTSQSCSYVVSVPSNQGAGAGSSGSSAGSSGGGGGSVAVSSSSNTNVGSSGGGGGSVAVSSSSNSSGGGGGGGGSAITTTSSPTSFTSTTSAIPATSVLSTATKSSGLSEIQIQSIISLLKSFDVEKAVINEITIVLYGSSSGGTTASVPSSSGYTFTGNLSLNQENPEVKMLQQFLNTHGFIVASSGLGSPGNESTFFGAKTYSALIEFQKSVGLPATGWFGPLTRAKIPAL